MRLRRVAGWIALVALLELVTRWIVYGMSPAPLAEARSLGGQLGGPRFAIVLLVSLTLGALLAAGIVWLATLGVRERWELAAARPDGPMPTVSPRRLIVRALALTLAGWLTFAGVESVIHLRAGLGFHGLECLIGPVHRNALPVVAGLAVVASALSAAAGLLLAWMRRTVARFGRPALPAVPALAAAAPFFTGRPRRAPLVTGAPPRGPPVLVA